MDAYFARRVLGLVILLFTPEVTSAQIRNPFGIKKDVPNPQGQDVVVWAAGIQIAGGPADANAARWTPGAPVPAAKGTIDGAWHGRWKESNGAWITAVRVQIKTVGNRVFILHQDSDGDYLIETIRNGDRLVGRYFLLSEPKDSTPVVLRVIDEQRIDGIWKSGPGARWDFRRVTK